MTDVTVQEIADSLYLLKVADHSTKYFEAMWSIPEGITYNAYLLKTPAGAVLFDGWKHLFVEEFVETLSSLVSLEDIKHIVVQHMEPDHSGSLPEILALTRNQAQVVGHPFSERLIKGLYGLAPSFRPVKNGDTLTIGGRTLTFVQTPWLHWPETMITYLPAEGIIITGDIFGGFSIPSGTFDDEIKVDNYLPFARKYTTTVIGHYKEKIAQNVAKLQKLGVDPKMILPAHGLLWRQAPERIIQAYLDWGKGTPQPGKVTIVYSSMYRFVERSVNVAADELKKLGYTPVMHRIVDDHHASLADILSDIADSEAIVMGTETYESDVFPYMEFILSEMCKKVEYEKPFVLITVFGWAAAAGKKLKEQLEKSKFNLVETVACKGMLTPESEVKIRESIAHLNEQLR